MANRTTRTPEKDFAFLDALSDGASIAKAARAAGYGRSSVYEWREADAAFAAAWDAAEAEGTDLLEDEAVRRARDGTSKPVFYQGSQCGTVQEYSDTLMIFMLKARRPEKFKDRLEHTGKNGGPIETKEVSDTELARRVAFLLTRATREPAG